jgi:hypothetical protein
MSAFIFPSCRVAPVSVRMYKRKNLHHLSTPEVLHLNPSSLTIRVERYSQEATENLNDRQGVRGDATHADSIASRFCLRYLTGDTRIRWKRPLWSDQKDGGAGLLFRRLSRAWGGLNSSRAVFHDRKARSRRVSCIPRRTSGGILRI